MSKNRTLSVKQLIQLKSLLSYDPNTGVFTRLKDISNVKSGSVAGSLDAEGYWRIKFQKDSYLAHRLAFYFMGVEPPEYVDHRNGNKADNRWSNLRGVTFVSNVHNQKRRKNNLSGFKGVSYHKRMGKWAGKITIRYEQKHLGYFDTPEEAHEAYKKAADKYHGDFKNYG